MAKSKGSFGKFLAFATIAGAAAAGISYFTKYRSFHKELEEDFHDFEEDGEDYPIDSTMSRNYVPINPEKSTAPGTQAGHDQQKEEDSAGKLDALYSNNDPDMPEETAPETTAEADSDADGDGSLQNGGGDAYSFTKLDDRELSDEEKDPVKKIDPQPDAQADTIIVEEFQ